ncbi:ricin-type beta-trefoil lectin domain protein, partial [Streptomyces apricus]|uniref:ricin-type beta-trefoil lectin domain protein n=1 Tax=Streptomyces apricus TaxID=1828112 RepID=UPI001F2626EB
MARGEGDEGDDGAGTGAHTEASDARLTELLRADTTTGHAALRELRAHHEAAVLGYARLCTTGESAARELTDRAFTVAAQETVRGIDPRGPWRHQLLLLAWRVAVTWAGDQRSRRLDPGLLARWHEAGPGGPLPPMLDAFHSQPTRVQGLVWYATVEREPAEETARLLGITREDVTYGTGSAGQALRAAFLTSHLAASGDPRCQDFRRLIEEAVRPETPRRSADLQAHMAECGHCATAYGTLSALRDDERTALAEGLLPWGGTAYAAYDSYGPGGAGGPGGVGGPGGASDGVWPPSRPSRSSSRASRASRAFRPSRRLVLASAALGVALVPLLLLLGSSDGDRSRRTGGTAAPVRPPVTVTATVPTTPRPSTPATESPGATDSASPT